MIVYFHEVIHVSGCLSVGRRIGSGGGGSCEPISLFWTHRLRITRVSLALKRRHGRRGESGGGHEDAHIAFEEKKKFQM